MFSAGKLAIGVCARCGMTFEYPRLREDGNIKGLYVCDEGCYDEIDPYKLPPRPPDSFVLHHPRPDAVLTLTAASVVPATAIDLQDGSAFLLENGDYLVLE